MLSTVKGQSLSALNNWRSIAYITRQKSVISLEDRISLFIFLRKKVTYAQMNHLQ